jgi:hypothetical protein
MNERDYHSSQRERYLHFGEWRTLGEPAAVEALPESRKTSLENLPGFNSVGFRADRVEMKRVFVLIETAARARGSVSAGDSALAEVPATSKNAAAYRLLLTPKGRIQLARVDDGSTVEATVADAVRLGFSAGALEASWKHIVAEADQARNDRAAAIGEIGAVLYAIQSSPELETIKRHAHHTRPRLLLREPMLLLAESISGARIGVDSKGLVLSLPGAGEFRNGDACHWKRVPVTPENLYDAGFTPSLMADGFARLHDQVEAGGACVERRRSSKRLCWDHPNVA